MEIQLDPNEIIHEYTREHFQELPPQQVYGVSRRPEDPPIRQLLRWGYADDQTKSVAPEVSSKAPERISEHTDEYRGYFYSQNQDKYYQIRQGEAEPIAEEADDLDAGQSQLDSERTGNRSTMTGEEQGKILAKVQEDEDPESIRRREQRIKKLHQTTRWMPNSGFTTYFGKPAFHNYGNANTKPTFGGLGYGQYMKSHSISAHLGDSKPEYHQIHQNAERIAQLRKPIQPQPPRKCKEEDRFTPKQIEELKARAPIHGEKKLSEGIKIEAPNLMEARRFASVHNTPEPSIDGDTSAAPKGKTAPKKTGARPQTGKPASRKAASSQGSKAATPKRAPGHAAKKSVDTVEFDLEERPSPVAPPKEEPIAEPKEETIESLKSGQEIESGAAEAKDATQRPKSAGPPKHFFTSYQAMNTGVESKAPKPYEVLPYVQQIAPPEVSQQLTSASFAPAEPDTYLGYIPPQERDPKNYKHLPSPWTQRIPIAGKISHKGHQAKNVIFYDSYNV